MRIALVAGQGLPNPDSGGSTLLLWTFVRYALDEGHEVAVVPLVEQGYVEPSGTTADARLERLTAIGAAVRPVESEATQPAQASLPARIRRWLDPPPELLFPTFADRGRLEDALREVAPDAVFAYHWEALAALDGVHVAPKLGVAVDLAHLPHLYRWRQTLHRHPAQALRALPHVQAIVRRQPRLMARFLADCDAAGDFAAHHAAWLRRHGVPGCEFLRMPIPDPGPAVTPRARNAKPTVLLVGHLRGTATLAGLDLFARHTLPRLEDEFGVDGFAVRVIGGYEPPPSLRRLLDRPAVTVCGFVDDIGLELRRADVVAVPTPIRLGARARIVTAFSYGAPVVAHASNRLGLPDLVDGDNILLAADGRGIADSISRLLADRALRDALGARGRETFEQLYAPPAAASRIVSILERLSGSRSTTPLHS